MEGFVFFLKIVSNGDSFTSASLWFLLLAAATGTAFNEGPPKLQLYMYMLYSTISNLANMQYDETPLGKSATAPTTAMLAGFVTVSNESSTLLMYCNHAESRNAVTSCKGS